MQKWLTLVLTLSLVVACTPLPTQGVSKATLPLDWPVSPPNKQQIASVRACDLESLAKERYPDAVKSDDLLASYAPKSGCDWAILALAYVMRLGEDEPLPESAKEAFTQAVSRNIAFALATPIFYWYFGTVPLVNAPAFAHREITDVRISYQ